MEITMTKTEQLFLQIIYNTCTGSSSNIDISDENLDELILLASTQSAFSFLLPYLKDFSSGKKSNAVQRVKRQSKLMMLNYYQIEHFTYLVADLFEANDISYVLLKGISLAAFYPVPEYRSLGDVDIYIPDRQMFNRADKLLRANGFTCHEEIGSHHQEYHFTFPQTGRSFILELHYRVVGTYQYVPANQLIDKLYSSSSFEPKPMEIHGHTYTVLPETLCTFHMIHHMLKHYLYSGFGIRLLCDFTFYIEKNYKQIDFDLIHKWCHESKIFHLYEIIVESCRIYLGLPDDIDSSIHYSKDACEDFILQLLHDGDGSQSNSPKLVRSTSYNKVNFFTYFKEGHHQMHVRFPKLGKHPILWPALWFLTLVFFIYNTYSLRKTTLKDTLRDFKNDNKKSSLIRIFDNSDT